MVLNTRDFVDVDLYLDVRSRRNISLEPVGFDGEITDAFVAISPGMIAVKHRNFDCVAAGASLGIYGGRETFPFAPRGQGRSLFEERPDGIVGKTDAHGMDEHLLVYAAFAHGVRKCLRDRALARAPPVAEFDFKDVRRPLCSPQSHKKLAVGCQIQPAATPRRLGIAIDDLDGHAGHLISAGAGHLPIDVRLRLRADGRIVQVDAEFAGFRRFGGDQGLRACKDGSPPGDDCEGIDAIFKRNAKSVTRVRQPLAEIRRQRRAADEQHFFDVASA